MAKKKYYIKINLNHPLTYRLTFLEHLRDFANNVEQEGYVFVPYFYFQRPALASYDTFHFINTQEDEVLGFPYREYNDNVLGTHFDKRAYVSGLNNLVQIFEALSPLCMKITEAYIIAIHGQENSSMECFKALLNALFNESNRINLEALTIESNNYSSFERFILFNEGFFSKSSISLKHLSLYINGADNLIEQEPIMIDLKFLSEALEKTKAFKSIKLSIPENNPYRNEYKSLLTDVEGIREFIKAASKIKVCLQGFDLLIKTHNTVNSLEQCIQNEFYLSNLPEFFRSLIDSKLSIAVKQEVSTIGNTSSGTFSSYSIDDFLKRLAGLLKDSNPNFTLIDNRLFATKLMFGRIFSSRRSLDIESSEETLEQDTKLYLKPIVENFGHIEPNAEQQAGFIVATKSGEKFELDYENTQLLADIALINGYYDFYKIIMDLLSKTNSNLISSLISNFWYKHRISKGDDSGIEFGDKLINKEILEIIASFLRQDKHISQQKDIGELHFIDEQMDTVGRLMQAKSGNSIQYINAIDGRVRDEETYREYLGNALRPYMTQEEPFVMPILINANDGASSEFGNHWMLYFHYGANEGGFPSAYIIDPLSDGTYHDSVNRIREEIGRVLGNNGESIEYIQAGLQTDSYNCGPWVLYLIQKLQEQMERATLDDVSGHDLVTHTIESLRNSADYIETIRENYEAYITEQNDYLAPVSPDGLPSMSIHPSYNMTVVSVQPNDDNSSTQSSLGSFEEYSLGELSDDLGSEASSSSDELGTLSTGTSSSWF